MVCSFLLLLESFPSEDGLATGMLLFYEPSGDGLSDEEEKNCRFSRVRRTGGSIYRKQGAYDLYHHGTKRKREEHAPSPYLPPSPRSIHSYCHIHDPPSTQDGK